MLKKYAIIYVVTFWCFLISSSSIASEHPIEMLENITKNVMIKLKDNSQTLKHEPENVYPIIDTIILPHIDFHAMARWTVGRNAWHAADDTTREAFVCEFRNFIVKNYTHFLIKFRNEKVAFFPLRQKIKDQQEIRVSSEIKKESGTPIRMDYRLIRRDNAWRVFDIIVEDVSLLKGYKNQFANAVKKGGIPAVIEAIRHQR
ncbi:MAG TPA: ABC transporter substrate-binding protein [Gammaproteobacteria bacterium]|nr:ABC transporter substrate-binding protein [Gammaproteobacteria bacterium]